VGREAKKIKWAKRIGSGKMKSWKKRIKLKVTSTREVVE